MCLTMNITKLHMFGILAALGSMAVIGAINPALAIPNGHANPMGFVANTNQDHIQSCKEFNTAQYCATGPGNNGEFTSGIAHQVNGP